MADKENLAHLETSIAIYEQIYTYPKKRAIQTWRFSAQRRRRIKGVAKDLIEDGWIPKSKALEMVKLCPKCYGMKLEENKCQFCKGRGIVLK